jgi:hypothetical protein
MGIVRRTVVEGTCDSCESPIREGERYIDASVYGVAFHTGCFREMGSITTIKALGLDDIYLDELGSDERGEKLAYYKGVI